MPLTCSLLTRWLSTWLRSRRPHPAVCGVKCFLSCMSYLKHAMNVAFLIQVGEALGGNGTQSLFFNADCKDLGALLSNPAVVH